MTAALSSPPAARTTSRSSRARASSGSPPARTTPPTANAAAVEYTRAGNFTTNSAGYLVTQDGYYLQGRTAGGADTLIQVPPGSTNVSIGQNGEVSLCRRHRHARHSGFLSLATFSNKAGLSRGGSNRWLAERELGCADRRHPGAPRWLHHRRRDRDVQRGPRPVVHEHDHRAARLPGQLARHLDGSTRCCRTWST